MLLRPADACVPQRVYDGVVHYGVRLAPLALHCLERLQRSSTTCQLRAMRGAVMPSRRVCLSGVFPGSHDALMKGLANRRPAWLLKEVLR